VDDIVSPLVSFHQMLSQGSIVLETPLSTAGIDASKSSVFRTTIQIDGDIINSVPNPQELAPGESIHMWAEAARQHQQTLARRLKFILSAPRYLPGTCFGIGVALVLADVLPLARTIFEHGGLPAALLSMERLPPYPLEVVRTLWSHSELGLGALVMLIARKPLYYTMALYRRRLLSRFRHQIDRLGQKLRS